MKAEQFLTEKSDWFDKSPGGEKLYFESEVIRMMNDYANEALRIHDVVGRSEQLLAYTEWLEKEGLLNATVSKLIVKKYQSK